MGDGGRTLGRAQVIAPGPIDRAAAIITLSPLIYDYVVMSHEGAPPSLPYCVQLFLRPGMIRRSGLRVKP
jgi:hypothetical protein